MRVIAVTGPIAGIRCLFPIILWIVCASYGSATSAPEAADEVSVVAKDEGKSALGAGGRIGAGSDGFNTVGIYVTPPDEAHLHYYDFWKECGYNYLEFCEGGFSRRPELLGEYYKRLSAQIRHAQQRGFQVWVLLLACMKQWQGPAEQGSMGTFCALNRDLLEERYIYIERAVRELSAADGFVFFAGDPGGDPEGRSSVRDCLNMSRRVHQIVTQNASQAGFVVNLWAIAEWDGFPSPFSLEFWRKQVLLSRAVAEEDGFLGPDCGVVFSLDNYYRSLTLTCYSAADTTPQLYPQVADVTSLRQRGVRPILGWPYFLVDEVDDGFITPNNVVSRGQSQAETRYIRAVTDVGRSIGLDGMVTNSAYVAAEQLNIYAFARMCRSATATPEGLLDEYAGIIAADETRKDLALILRYIENHSNWENSLPLQYRLPNFDCGGITSPQFALERLKSVQARRNPPLTLPEPPTEYLLRLTQRLQKIEAGDIGGVAPIVQEPKSN